MGSKELNVEELRTQLLQRRLSISGIKPTLVKRLDSAIRNENTKSAVKKRERDPEESNGSLEAKVPAFAKYREMGVQQLRQQATLRGVSTAGTKKQLLERLCLSQESQDHLKVEQDEVRKEEKIVKATKKGAAVLDQWLPDEIKAHYHVMQLGEDIYDAMLNQTNVGANNNKFYVLQLLESDDGGTFMVYYRWGRVGVKGQNKLQGPYTSRDSAIEEFEQKFLAKTKNDWSDRWQFVCHPKSYTWLEMDYREREEELAVKENATSITKFQPRDTKLEPRIAKFISLICNISMMKQQMMEIGYNAEKLPLGKLSKTTILKGYSVLKRIADVIGKPDRKTLEQLSGEFYTVIPHDFGFRKMREFVIDSPHKLKRKLEMVEALCEIEVATKLLKDDNAVQDDPLHSHYQHLQCKLTPVEVNSEEFSVIVKYMQNTHAKTHSSYSVDIVQIFRVSKEGEVERFRKFSSLKNRMLLWHGSRLTNWMGILSQGLRIAPPEAPVTGYMFGKGVYFADMFSKSANYCYSTPTTAAGVLLLCEVALGDMAEHLTANFDADKLPAGKHSTKGVGKTAPDLSKALKLEDGVIVPLGQPKERVGRKGDLRYNEYIVYNVDQIMMRYVVQVNFKFK